MQISCPCSNLTPQAAILMWTAASEGGDVLHTLLQLSKQPEQLLFQGKSPAPKGCLFGMDFPADGVALQCPWTASQMCPCGQIQHDQLQATVGTLQWGHLARPNMQLCETSVVHFSLKADTASMIFGGIKPTFFILFYFYFIFSANVGLL